MTVSLSPVGGAASQFFNSGGVPLYGGKIYTYEAGTTTPKATYTEANGLTAHPNPIILDSAGRVPSGEIWLTSAQAYLFILKTSSEELIGTYDNLYGIAAGAENAVTEVQVATAGQTSFVLTSMTYTPGVFTLGVYIDGVNQVVNNSYVETSATTVTFVSGLHAGAVVKFININSAATDANVVTYLPAGAGADTTTVQAKLRESVSVLDFGASPIASATTNTAAIQAAVDYCKANSVGALTFEGGNYNTNAAINIKGGFGDGLYLKGNKTTITCSADVPVFSLDGTSPSPAPEYRMNHIIDGFILIGSGDTNLGSAGIQVVGGANVTTSNCILKNAYRGWYGYGALICDFNGVIMRNCTVGMEAVGNGTFQPNSFNFTDCQFLQNIQAIRAVAFDYGVWNFYGCEIEGNNYVVPGTSTDAIRVCEFVTAGDVNFYGCHFESNYGQYHIYYSGNRFLNFYGSKLIPSGVAATVGYVVYMATGNLGFFNGDCQYNYGPNIYLVAGASAIVTGDTSGSITGDLSKLTHIRYGQIRTKGAVASTADVGIVAKGAGAYGIDVEGALRYVDSTSTRLGYSTPSAVVLDAASGYQIATGSGWVDFMRTGLDMEPGADGTYSFGSAVRRWLELYAKNGMVVTTPDTTKRYRISVNNAGTVISTLI